MLSFGNALCAAQISARPKSSIPFHEKLCTYVSPRVSAFGKSKVERKERLPDPWPKVFQKLILKNFWMQTAQAKFFRIKDC